MAHCTSSFGLPEYTTFGVVYSGVSDQYGVKDAACPISTKGGGGGGEYTTPKVVYHLR